jgi:hypothetical protein
VCIQVTCAAFFFLLCWYTFRSSSLLILTTQKYVMDVRNMFNLYATGFKWLQSTFAYDIIFAWHLNFCTWFTKNFIISGTKKDLIMD